MSGGWKLVARAPREAAEAALAVHAARDEWDEDVVVGASELAEDPGTWLLEAWLARPPAERDREAIRALFAGPSPELIAEPLPETDWVAASQARAAPVRAGPFRIRTPDHPPAPGPEVIEFCIPAAQAFGTGQHATTAGCLAMLAAMRRRGVRPRRIADIGTGTGLLAFAALALWPRASIAASDNDPLCTAALVENAARNAVPLGSGPGALAFALADGLEGELHARLAPYGLVIANILAGPLIALAPDFAAAIEPRGHLLLAGLLAGQERAVRSAFLRAGFVPVARFDKGEWVILWLRRRWRR